VNKATKIIGHFMLQIRPSELFNLELGLNLNTQLESPELKLISLSKCIG